jgi:hypothetical protein
MALSSLLLGWRQGAQQSFLVWTLLVSLATLMRQEHESSGDVAYVLFQGISPTRANKCIPKLGR